MLKPWFKNIWFQTKSTISTKRWKTSFPKEIVEKTDLHKPVLDKIMTTEEQCVKYEKDEITNWIKLLECHDDTFEGFKGLKIY